MLTSPEFWYIVLASTTPVLFSTLSAILVDRAGIFNLGIEGTMSMAALSGVLISAFTGSLFWGGMAGIVTGVIISLLLGYFTLYLDAPFNSVGVAINLAATGTTIFILDLVAGSKVTSTSLISRVFPEVKIPIIHSIPFIGKVLSGHNVITYLSWLALIGSYYLLFHTKLGLEIRAIGENELAAKTAGINTKRIQMITLAITGVLSSFGGMYLSMGVLKSYTVNMVSGRGFLALAMNAMSQGNPFLGALGAMMYGFSQTITVYLQMYTNLDIELIDSFPYIFILIMLIIVKFIRNTIEKRKQLEILKAETK